MSLAPLLAEGFAIQLHAFCAIAAFVLGLLQFALPKGNTRHKIFGYCWVAIMVTVAISSFWIHGIDMWNGFSPIHLISIYVLYSLPLAILAARRGEIAAHKTHMRNIFIGGLVIAGILSFLPGRTMLKVLIGEGG